MRLMTRLRSLEQRQNKITGVFLVFDHGDGTFTRQGVRYESIDAVQRAAPPGHMIMRSFVPEPDPVPPELAAVRPRSAKRKSSR